MVLISTFIGSLLQKPPTSTMPYADWINCRDVTRHGLTNDACSIADFSEYSRKQLSKHAL